MDYYTEIESHAAEAERLIHGAEPGSPHETARLRSAVGQLVLCIRALRGEVERLRQRAEAMELAASDDGRQIISGEGEPY